jgi:hypothetical protein
MNNQIYQTTDTLEVAYLISCGFNYKEMTFINDERVVFIFDFTKELSNEVTKFRAGKALIEPTKFHYNYIKLLAEIRSLKNKQKWQELKSFRHPKHNW